MTGMARKFFLIVDGDPIHRSWRGRRIIESFGGHLGLFFLPPYSLKLNSDELSRLNLKGTATGGASSSSAIYERITSVLRSAQ